MNIQIGQENYFRVINKTGSTINKNTIVKINCVSQGHLFITKLTHNTYSKNDIIGLTIEDIKKDEESMIMTFNDSGFIFAPQIKTEIITIDKVREYIKKMLKQERIEKIKKINESR